MNNPTHRHRTIFVKPCLGPPELKPPIEFADALPEDIPPPGLKHTKEHPVHRHGDDTKSFLEE